MWALRLIVGLAAVAFFLAAVRAYQHRNLSRLSLITAFVATVVVVLLAALPDLFDPVFDTFNFAPGNNRRIIAVLVAAVVVLFLMLFRLQGHSDQSERAIRQLVEALGVERFDWDEAAARVAGGPKIVTISPAFNEAENVGAVIEAMPKEVAGYRGDPDRGGRLLRRRHRRSGACGRSAGRPPADPPRRWPRAPRGLRHRA